VVAALFVLGPERLPAAAAWLGGAIRKGKALAASANAQITSELGPELDQLRVPLAELRAPLQELRALRDPRGAVLRHLLAGDASLPTVRRGPPAS
jgi:sec-independent protein translocase protein TatB